MPELTEDERRMLALEGQWWRYQGAKDSAITEVFGVTPTRYYQRLNALIDRSEALEHAPMAVKRLRRLRDERHRRRTVAR